MANYLTEIIAAHRAAAGTDDRDLDELVTSAGNRPPTRGFADALERTAADGLAVIAEVKRRSPSKGDLDPGLDPADVAAAYAAGGAACLSVLTDERYFGGSADDLVRARAAISVPVLRKDFTVSARDVCDARLMGADAVLLIAAALSDEELAEFATLAASLGLDALVEVHDEPELERALAVGPRLIGVNQRDLHTFTVDTARALRMVASIPSSMLAVAESGIADGDDAARLADAGYQAVLVGETLVRAPDRSVAVGELAGHPVGSRSGSAIGRVR